MVLDCQADVLGHEERRFVVPLLPSGMAPRALPRLTPIFTIDGQRFTMATPLAASVPRRELGEEIASLASERDRIIGAIDMLVTGV